jgi:HEAT repeat protein
MVMTRYPFLCNVAVVTFLIGCGETPRPVMTAHDADLGAPEATVTSQQPDLQAVPPAAVSSRATATRAREVFAAIIKAAEAGDAEAWTRAEGELHTLGLAAVPALAERLGDESNVARELGAMFLAQLGPDASPAAEGLAKLLTDQSTFARVNAAAALSTFDGYADEVVPVLAELLADADDNVRLTAATSIRNAGPSGKQAVGALTRSLRDADSRVRAAAAVTLGELGQFALQSLPTLRQLDNDEDDQVKTAAARAIKQIDETARDASPVTIPASATE